MTVCSYVLPWGGVLRYENSTVPRLGEHVSFNEITYVVVEVRHFPAANSALLNLKSADGI